MSPDPCLVRAPLLEIPHPLASQAATGCGCEAAASLGEVAPRLPDPSPKTNLSPPHGQASHGVRGVGGAWVNTYFPLRCGVIVSGELGNRWGSVMTSDAARGRRSSRPYLLVRGLLSRCVLEAALTRGRRLSVKRQGSRRNMRVEAQNMRQKKVSNLRRRVVWAFVGFQALGASFAAPSESSEIVAMTTMMQPNQGTNKKNPNTTSPG